MQQSSARLLRPDPGSERESKNRLDEQVGKYGGKQAAVEMSASIACAIGFLVWRFGVYFLSTFHTPPSERTKSSTFPRAPVI